MKKLNKNHLYYLILLLLLDVSSVFAQEIQWQNTIGGTGYDAVTALKKTSDGGYILGGWSDSNISSDKSENGYGSDDYWIIKTDENGNIQWENTIGGNSGDRLRCVEQTADGGVIVAGYSNSGISGDKTELSLGSLDYWIVKTDLLGNIQWQKTIGGTQVDQLMTMCLTTDGGYIFGGWSNSDSSGNKTVDSKGGYDYWIVKTDSIGNVQWEKTIGGSSDDNLQSIKKTTDGGYILGGYSESNISGDKSENSIGGSDYWIVKIDSLGMVQWQKTLGGTLFEFFSSAHQTSDGGYILGGNSMSGLSGSKTEPTLGGNDYWIVKIDSIGNILWQNTIGGDLDDYLLEIEETFDEGFIIGGYSRSGISGDKTEICIGGNDFWIVKINSMGQLLWQNTIGGILRDNLYVLTLTSDGGCVAGGASESVISGDKTENCKGNFDYWILKTIGYPNLITGELFGDINNNSVRDVGEMPLQSKRVVEQNTGNLAFSDVDGYYSLMVNDTGNFIVFPPLVSWWYPVPLFHPAYFGGIMQTDSLNDFAFKTSGAFEDVCIKITPLGNFRSGFNAHYQVSYVNNGNTTVSPTVYFYPFSNVTFQSATLTPNNITPDSVVWNLPLLTPFQTGSIIVTVNVNLGLPIGTLINSSAHIEPYLTDDNPSCNNSNWEVYTTGSFDPNDILVSEDTLTDRKSVV